MMRAIDISRAQGTIDWDRVARAGISAVAIKASQGSHPTPAREVYLRTQAAGARGVGLSVMAYHFANLGDPVAEAHCFAESLCGVRVDRIVLDVEPSGSGDAWGPQGITREALREWVRAWAAEAGKPVLYCPASRSYVATLVGLRLPMWLASRPWGTATPPTAIVDLMRRAPTRDWLAWQYASKTGRVDGIEGPVDLSLMREA